MSEHYFSKQPQSKRSPKQWKYQLRGNEFRFTSDVGVFSKNEVDFGSRLLIEQFTEPNVEGDLLDLGCGYGPIGISLAASYPKRNVVMSDVNERAIQLAEKNAKNNQISNVEVARSDGFSGLTNRMFAAVVTNPPIRAGKRTVHQLFEDSKKALKEDGTLWVVIQKKQGAPSAKEKIDHVFGNVEVIARRKGYYLLRALNI